jgi:hypothetical protein
MKTCSRCKVEKPELEFNRSSARKDGLQNYCKICHTASVRDYARRNRSAITARAKERRRLNPEMVNEWNRRRAEKRHGDPEYKRRAELRSKRKNARENKVLADEYKHFFGCFICGEDQPHRLSFHHLRPEAKDGTVANRVYNGFSSPLGQQEVRKCIVLCGNCHLDVHHWMRQEKSLWSLR